MTPFLGEVVGRMLLVTPGDGVVANVLLNKTRGQNNGWLVITTGWALAVTIAVCAVNAVSGAHINPAVAPLLVGPIVGGVTGALLYTALWGG